MSTTKLRFGILGAANIAQKNWKGIWNSGNATVTAVGSRDLKRSQQFIDQCQAEAPMDKRPNAFASYADVIASPEVDAVYIPLPTGVRKEWVLKAAAAGKHIVCEKPCAGTVSDLEEMLKACREHNVQFMDGVMFMHSRRLEAIRDVLKSADGVGRIKRITSAFTFGSTPEFFSSNIRTNGDLEPMGCLGDLGWYCIRFALWLMDWQMPRKVTGSIVSQFARPDSQLPVPTDFCSELLFDQEVSASFYCSFIAANQQWAKISGDQGYLELDDFVLPFAGSELRFQTQKTEFHVKGCDFRMQPTIKSFAVSEHSHGDSNAQESNLFRNFSNQSLSGSLNAAWREIALKTQKVACACLESARQDGRSIAP
ncbi:MAG TPA: Gfo/Idh/MocA family oxidoreductase [Candidatus Limnocylindrales bacterium]|jgi:predicted dehydrogenase|nr:Gfo/Idh/MocA family oxidoreductase [Candidatus Limnocylindrales bacterium]